MESKGGWRCCEPSVSWLVATPGTMSMQPVANISASTLVSDWKSRGEAGYEPNSHTFDQGPIHTTTVSASNMVPSRNCTPVTCPLTTWMPITYHEILPKFHWYAFLRSTSRNEEKGNNYLCIKYVRQTIEKSCQPFLVAFKPRESAIDIQRRLPPPLAHGSAFPGEPFEEISTMSNNNIGS